MPAQKRHLFDQSSNVDWLQMLICGGAFIIYVSYLRNTSRSELWEHASDFSRSSRFVLSFNVCVVNFTIFVHSFEIKLASFVKKPKYPGDGDSFIKSSALPKKFPKSPARTSGKTQHRGVVYFRRILHQNFHSVRHLPLFYYLNMTLTERKWMIFYRQLYRRKIKTIKIYQKNNYGRSICRNG